MKKFKLGIYKHFKGNKYLVLGLAKHSETLEDMVVYIPLYESDTSNMWVRPLELFLDDKEVDGKKVERFKFVSDY